ncbi:Uncharacterised protein [Mycobacteroides abscessus subsp. abscessus]|nr:Uncharacterised protein [Mycobacteroides abscessus subsp. abscessus]
MIDRVRLDRPSVREIEVDGLSVNSTVATLPRVTGGPPGVVGGIWTAETSSTEA